MIVVEIADGTVDEYRGQTREGREFVRRSQRAYFHLPHERYPVSGRVTLSDGQSAYPVGRYTLAPDSFWVDRYGGLRVTPRLIEHKQRSAA